MPGPNTQWLIDRVGGPLESVLRLLGRFHGHDRHQVDAWLANERDSLAALAVGQFALGMCKCYQRFQPSKNPRLNNFMVALARHDQQHDINAENLRRAGLLLQNSLELKAEFNGQTLTATLRRIRRSRGAVWIVEFAGQDYESLSKATYAAKESVVGAWPKAGYEGFWECQTANGNWQPLKEAAEIEPAAVLRHVTPVCSYTSVVEFDGSVTWAGDCYESPAAAAHEICAHQQRWDANGWRFWQFEAQPGEWQPLGTLRLEFFTDLLSAADPGAYWSRVATTGQGSLEDFVYVAIVGGSFPANARQIARTITFPEIRMPDMKQLDSGEVLVCHAATSHKLTRQSIKKQAADLSPANANLTSGMSAAASGSRAGKTALWVEFLARIRRREDLLWQLLLRALDAAQAEAVVAALDAACDGSWQVAANHWTSGRPTLLAVVISTLNGLLRKPHLIEELRLRRALPLPEEARELLAESGLGDLDDLTLAWLNRQLLAGMYPNWFDAPTRYNGCGCEVDESCSFCRGQQISPPPRIAPSLRLFPRGDYEPRLAWRCRGCQNYWFATAGDASVCPRCGGRHSERPTTVWKRIRSAELPAHCDLDEDGCHL